MKTKLLSFLLLLAACQGISPKSKPVVDRLQWWQDAKMGLFIHWGPVSLIGKEISWSREGYGKSKYDSLYLRFNPQKFNAREWVALAKAGGMKYIVLTAKHHDGFCLFNTKTTGYNIMNSPFGRDVSKELAEAAHEAGMPIGWYYSVADWKDPDCRNPSTNEVFNVRVEQQVRELLTNYGKISVLWIDYEGSPSPIHPKRVYDLARKLQPEIIINNRLEPFNTDESHSRVGPYADYATPEGFVAGYGKVPWETCTNMGHQWAWKFGDSPRSLKESVHTLLRCVGGNGNLLFNIGPDSTGVFPENFVQRTHEMGSWLTNNAAAIYQTQAGIYTPSADYVSSQKGNQLFVHLLSDSAEELKLPPIPAKIETAALMNGEKVMFTQNSSGVTISFPKARRDSIATIVNLTLDRPAAAVKKTIPFSTTESLAYGKNVSASSSVGEFLHDPTAAFDDNPKTFWKMGRRSDIDFDKLYGKTIHYRSEDAYKLFQNKGWLEVDLSEPKTVGQIRLEEAVFFDSKIKQFEVQYESNGKWLSVVSDDEMGSWSKNIPPVISQKFRLVIKDSFGYCGVSEFQVFPPKN